MNQARQRLESVKNQILTAEERGELAIELADLMLKEARRIQQYSEKCSQAQLARLMKDPIGKVFTTSMTDQCFRSNRSKRIADQLTYLIEKYGIPHYLSFSKKAKLAAFNCFGKPLAALLVPMAKRQMRTETSAVILPGEPEELSKHMRKRRDEGVRINLNHLGEAILGEEEAKHRLDIYLNDLANPEIEYISVKISTICSQINLLGWEDTLAILCSRLKKLYRAAKQNFFLLPNGKKVPKFVNLDMEEYRDLHITVELFRRVLDDAEFYEHSAGIVLQSYLPDSFLIQQDLTAWAMKRVANKGAPIKIRLVKGANLAMEKVEASLKDWTQAPYAEKEEVDANFKRMVTYGCEPERAAAAHLGIASHNLFDIAYALLLCAEKEIQNYVCFEMLEGMADHIRRVVQKLSRDMLLYCPVATENDFQNAVAYLVRRLDENTAPENFLRHTFDMSPGTKEWQSQIQLFLNACKDINKVYCTPRRKQNRLEQPARPDYHTPFANEPDTDWSLPQNRKWAERILREWSGIQPDVIPLVLGEMTISTGLSQEEGKDPSIPGKVLYRYALAGENELDIAIQTAVNGFRSWNELPFRKRMMLLDEVAHELRSQRANLIGAMVADTGKTVAEADAEVSEAIDFATFYRHNVEEIHFMKDLRWKPKGPTLVAPPWNFPCSISAGGILAALAAGNSVIFKPAPEAVLVGWHLANIFWKAGIGKDVLQFFCCADDSIGSRLIQDTRLTCTILTGATSTAKLFYKLRPGLDLLAETGGKNAMIITSMADRDLAIKDLIQSAFGHAGQKCSACSLAILEKEVYEDRHFRKQLCDAAASLRVGPAWNLSTRLNPLIHVPNQTLERGLTTLEPGEEWLLQPKQDPFNPNLWSPGIKLGVQPGSFTHQTELFGPVLGLICANDLDDAIEIANGTPYGLTSGLHSLDEREQCYWQEKIEAGNCYINRGITGAIVRRQPFGGCKDSSFGKGAKAGGPNYVIPLMTPEQIALPKEQEMVDEIMTAFDEQIPKENWSHEELDLWKASIGSYAFFWNHYFAMERDPSRLLGQDNFLRYLPHPHQVLRIQAGDSDIDILRVLAAAITCGAALEISRSPEDSDTLFAKLPPKSKIKEIVESEIQFIERLKVDNIRRVRLLSTPNQTMQKALAEQACNVIIAPVLANGRIELLNFLREMSISIDYHRYGYLGTREPGAEPPPAKQSCGGQCSCKI